MRSIFPPFTRYPVTRCGNFLARSTGQRVSSGGTLRPATQASERESHREQHRGEPGQAARRRGDAGAVGLDRPGVGGGWSFLVRVGRTLVVSAGVAAVVVGARAA